MFSLLLSGVLEAMAIISEFKGEYRWLSNFHPSPVQMNHLTWKTVEHAYQAAKTDNPGEIKSIWLAPSPGLAKKLGRRVTVRPEWDDKRVPVMKALVQSKFNRNPSLMRLLIATKDAELVEGNWWHDNFWGDCGCSRRHQYQRADPQCNYPGANFLGHILMEIRQKEKG
jgi:ribA/ribD-fused uncharacterized protein